MEDVVGKIENWSEYVDGPGVEIIKHIDTKYDLNHILKFLKELKYGKEQKWFDDLVKKLEVVLPKDSDYINNLNVLRCFAITFPRVLHVLSHTFIFLIQPMYEIGYKTISEIRSTDSDTKMMYGRITLTVYQAAIQLIAHNARNMSGGEKWESVHPLPEQSNITHEGRRILDLGAWDEFMTYIEIDTDLLNPPEKPGCIMM